MRAAPGSKWSGRKVRYVIIIANQAPYFKRGVLLLMSSHQVSHYRLREGKEGSTVSEIDNNENPSVHVTGEERSHPSIRTLARACIALAELRIAEQQREPASPEPIDMAEEERHV